jgi:hypothetical protein
LADGGQSGADGQLAGNEVRATGRAARLGIIVGKPHAFDGQLVEIRRPNGHHALIVDTDIGPSDVVGHDDEDDIGLLLLLRRCWRARRGNKRREQPEPDIPDIGHLSPRELPQLLIAGRQLAPDWHHAEPR